MTSCGSAEFKLRWAFRLLMMMVIMLMMMTMLIMLMMTMLIMLMMIIMLAMNLRNENDGELYEFVFRLFDADESGNIELDEMFEIVATFYDMEVKKI